MKNTPTTIQNTELILKKSKATLDIGRRILSGSKSLTTKRDAVILHSDVMMINGLMWQKETAEKMRWTDAMDYAQNLSLAGYEDWRLPTIEELGDMVRFCGGILTTEGDDDGISKENRNNKSYQVSYEEIGFASYFYWSSTTNASLSGLAWGVIFFSGHQGYFYGDNKTYSFYVRCVRAG